MVRAILLKRQLPLRRMCYICEEVKAHMSDEAVTVVIAVTASILSTSRELCASFCQHALAPTWNDAFVFKMLYSEIKIQTVHSHKCSVLIDGIFNDERTKYALFRA
ncbi:unnamed protein product [Angiostrongylus costaricensis]|uniref:C2 domain-containing protein n=1 Tax=Angiostrongylus costaricensis TaxID=334426 RepID=A0A0R3PHW2_ANGCS|nr:unnamed protein product [Angiostrongylus costaricensis]